MVSIQMKSLIDRTDYKGIADALQANPELANEGIPYDAANPTKAHPLHRICDGVYNKTYTDEAGVRMAQLFLQHGAYVNGTHLIANQDSPLVAAASLHADQIALLYIAHGADINHPGCHGGTALHWAAWCGRPRVIQKLIESGAEINRLCHDYRCTPLFWTIHGLKSDTLNDTTQYLACVRLLLQAGVDKTVPNREGTTIMQMLEETDLELKELLE